MIRLASSVCAAALLLGLSACGEPETGSGASDDAGQTQGASAQTAQTSAVDADWDAGLPPLSEVEAIENPQDRATRLRERIAALDAHIRAIAQEQLGPLQVELVELRRKADQAEQAAMQAIIDNARPIAEQARACGYEGEGEIAFDPSTLEIEAEDPAARNTAIEEAYLAEVDAADCVYAFDTGLRVRINEAVEDAPSPEFGDRVTVHYEGTTPDGTVFDSSLQRGEPATFPSDGVIPGWIQALPLMREGESWTLFIPARLAYGEEGAGGGRIEPNQALRFDVRLLDLPDAPEATPEPGSAEAESDAESETGNETGNGGGE